MDDKAIRVVYFIVEFPPTPNTKGRWSMDSIDKISAQVADYVTAGQPSKALKVVARYIKNSDYNCSLFFCLNATLAVVRSRQPHVTRRRLLVRYLKYVEKCPEYHKDTEGNFWYMQAAVASMQKRPTEALMMYQWVLELGPGRRQVDIVDSYIFKIRIDYPDAVVRDKLMRKDLVKTPRHSQ
jgi:hypothetical protein